MAAYDYQLFANPHPLAPGTDKMSTEELTVGLTTALAPMVGQIGETLDSLDGGGWEIVSHELTKIENNLILTFLVRRPRRK